MPKLWTSELLALTLANRTVPTAHYHLRHLTRHSGVIGNVVYTWLQKHKLVSHALLL